MPALYAAGGRAVWAVGGAAMVPGLGPGCPGVVGWARARMPPGVVGWPGCPQAGLVGLGNALVPRVVWLGSAWMLPGGVSGPR